jgi:hypothetical protein
MLGIRNRQIEKMQAAREEEFCRSSVQFYRNRYPAFVKEMNDQELEQYISAVLNVARALGISSSEATTQYVAVAILGGPRFMSDQKVRTFMTRPGLSPDLRMRELLISVVAKLRTAVLSGLGDGGNG